MAGPWSRSIKVPARSCKDELENRVLKQVSLNSSGTS